MTAPLTAVEHAVTVRQPYAQCIAAGHKLIENRGRAVRYRGPIAIHAGKTAHERGDTDPRVIALYGVNPRAGMAVGAVVGVAELVDCHPAEDRGPGRTCCEPWGEPAYAPVPCFHLVLEHAVLLTSTVPARGSLATPWVMPSEVQVAVRAGLAEVATR